LLLQNKRCSILEYNYIATEALLELGSRIVRGIQTLDKTEVILTFNDCQWHSFMIGCDCVYSPSLCICWWQRSYLDEATKQPFGKL